MSSVPTLNVQQTSLDSTEVKILNRYCPTMIASGRSCDHVIAVVGEATTNMIATSETEIPPPVKSIIQRMFETITDPWEALETATQWLYNNSNHVFRGLYKNQSGVCGAICVGACMLLAYKLLSLRRIKVIGKRFVNGVNGIKEYCVRFFFGEEHWLSRELMSSVWRRVQDHQWESHGMRVTCKSETRNAQGQATGLKYLFTSPFGPDQWIDPSEIRADPARERERQAILFFEEEQAVLRDCTTSSFCLPARMLQVQ